MQVKHWGMQLILGAVLFAGVLSCRLSDTLISQTQPTTIPTRTPRPTFTPQPPPSPTVAPTVAVATKPPTARPATARPPTAKPVVAPTSPPPVAQPTAFPWTYHANPPVCNHSGITYLKGAVYNDKNDPNSKTPGITIALGGADGVTVYDKFVTEENGEYTFILSPPGAPGRVGTWYLWVIDGSGRRISEVGGPIKTNGLRPDDPGVCWAGSVDFWK